MAILVGSLVKDMVLVFPGFRPRRYSKNDRSAIIARAKPPQTLPMIMILVCGLVERWVDAPFVGSGVPEAGSEVPVTGRDVPVGLDDDVGDVELEGPSPSSTPAYLRLPFSM